MTERPLAVDLFAGAGGMSLGFEQAGFDVAAAVDSDLIHCAAYRSNFAVTTTIAQSVETLSGDAIREAAGLAGKDIACVFGGAPCQGFSMMGRRSLDDPRNRLVLDFVRLAVELQAQTFVFENVKGLTVGKHRKFLYEIVDAFEAAGYTVRLPWRVLNASQFGVPQHRERLFLIGARDKEWLPEYPASLPGAAPTCAEALGDLPDADQFGELLSSDEVRIGTEHDYSAYANDLRHNWHKGYIRKWDMGLLTSSARTLHTDESRRRFAQTAPGTTEPISRFYRLAPDGVAYTLRAGTDASRGSHTSPRPIHYAYPRCVTVREMARLHGYPDWFRFHHTKWHGARQVGNSVPPPLARAVANGVLLALGIGDIPRPTKFYSIYLRERMLRV